MRIKKSVISRFSSDFLYTVSAVVVLNLVQQVLIQPYINRVKGPAFLGDVLYYLGMTYVFSQMFGTVLGHQRLLYKHKKVTEGDFLVLLGCYSVIVFFIGLVDSYYKTNDLVFALLVAMFMFICTIRYYGQVEYRMSMNFKGYLEYFLILSFGYVVGLCAFQIVNNWLVIFIIGEIMAILFVGVRGTVFRFEKPSGEIRNLWIPTTVLIFSYLLSGTTYLDRILIQPILGSIAVTQFYAVSLVGKILNMLLQPIATLMLSYLADRKSSNISFGFYKKIIVIGIPICLLMIVLSCLLTPVAVYLLYPNMMGVVKELNIPINISNVMSFAGGLMITFLLAEASIKYQLVIRGLCFIVYIVSTFVLTTYYGLLGYSYAALMANVFCLLFSVCCGMQLYKKKERL